MPFAYLWLAVIGLNTFITLISQWQIPLSNNHLRIFQEFFACFLANPLRIPSASPPKPLEAPSDARSPTLSCLWCLCRVRKTKGRPVEEILHLLSLGKTVGKIRHVKSFNMWYISAINQRHQAHLRIEFPQPGKQPNPLKQAGSGMILEHQVLFTFTLCKTNNSPLENNWLEDVLFVFSDGLLSRGHTVSFKEGIYT